MHAKKHTPMFKSINSICYMRSICPSALTSLKQCDSASRARNLICGFSGDSSGGTADGFNVLDGGLLLDVSTSTLEELFYVLVIICALEYDYLRLWVLKLFM